MGKDGARQRAKKGGQSTQPQVPEKEEKRLKDEGDPPSEGSDSVDEDSDEQPTGRALNRRQRQPDERKSNAVVTVIAVLIVGALVTSIVWQRYKYEAKLRAKQNEDLEPLEELYDDDNDATMHGTMDSKPRDSGGSSSSSRHSGSQTRPPRYGGAGDTDEAEDDYDNPDGDDADDGDDGDDDDVGDGRKRKRAEDDDLADMQPTDPMEEEDVGDDRDMHLEKEEDKHDKYEGTLDSLMRPHEALKRDFWRHIKSKASAMNGTVLHPSGDIIQVDNVLSTTECLQLIQHHEKLAAEHENPPPWCFESEDWISRTLNEENIDQDTETFQINQAGSKNMFCAKSDDVHVRLSGKYPHSTATLIARGESDIVDAVEKKLDSQLGLPKDNAYHTQLVKYRQGEKYYPHVDCDPGKTPTTANRNDRLSTIIIYLSDVKKGGETTFTKLGVSVKPKRGSAIIFRNLDADGFCNIQMTHRGEAPSAGVKYIYQHWYHETIILPSYMQNVVLCDNSDSCREYIHARATREASELVRKGDKARPNIKKSAEFYRKALEKQPTHAQALLYMGDSLAQLKQDREALKYFEKHLNMHPKSIDGNFVAAGIWQDMGRRAKAIDLLQRVVAVSPQDGDALFNIATLYAEEGHKKKSVSALKSLVKVNPKDHGAHTFLAEMLTELGDDKGAEEHQAIAAKLKTRLRK